jgi:hypothetical protein
MGSRRLLRDPFAYGRLGDADVGGVEIIGYDPASERYQSYFFDSQGNAAVSQLSFSDDRWIWQGENTRTTSVFTGDGKTQTTLHERRDETKTGCLRWTSC